MNDLAELSLCEDDAATLPLGPKTVVFKGVWGSDSYASKILPVLGELATRVVTVGLRDEGIAVEFASRRDASMVRLFYQGETLTA